jgi:Ca2+-transporting ATPase
MSPGGSASTLWGVGGLSAAKAAERLQQNGPNALPAEKTVPGWRRFVDQYRSYCKAEVTPA